MLYVSEYVVDSAVRSFVDSPRPSARRKHVRTSVRPRKACMPCVMSYCVCGVRGVCGVRPAGRSVGRSVGQCRRSMDATEALPRRVVWLLRGCWLLASASPSPSPSWWQLVEGDSQQVK